MPLSPPVPLISDMEWCWWTRPRATRIDDVVYFGAIESTGGIVAATLNLQTRMVTRHRLAQFEADDHNNPALLATQGRPLICFYSRHDAAEGLRYRISRRPGDITDWGEERILTFNGSTTYAQAHLVDEELHLLTRVDETRWGWRMSSDWGQTWSPPRDLLAFDTDQQVYVATALLADGETMRLAASGHPKEYEKKPLHDVWAALVNLRTGDVTLPASGATIGNLRSGEKLPLDYSALELVQQTPADRTANLLDVSSGDRFEVAFSSKIKDDHSTRDARYHVASLRDGRWRTEDVAHAGRKFGYIDAGFYVGGMAFPERATSGQVYLTREEQGLWHLERWTRGSRGQWTGAALVAPSEIRLARPWIVDPPARDLGVVALALERYPDDDYMDTLSHLVGAPLGASK
jgi:hypothetical protein